MAKRTRVSRKVKAKTRKKAEKKTIVWSIPAAKPVMIQVGRSFVDPTDVAAIIKVRHHGLYVLRLKSNPNPMYTFWVKEHEIGTLLRYFDIRSDGVVLDEGGVDLEEQGNNFDADGDFD